MKIQIKEAFWVVVCVVLTFIVLGIGPVIWYRNFKECRHHNFSFIYCVTRK